MHPPTEPAAADALAIESAIAQVLHAEQAARASTEADAAQARDLVERAGAQARAVAERAAHRTVRVHQWADARIARQVAAIEAQRAQLDRPRPAGAGSADERVRAAVAQLAARLTGEDGTP